MIRIARAVLTCLLAVLGVLFLLSSANRVGGALAANSISVLYVAYDGDCGGAAPCYTTIQDAADAAGDGDSIRVAGGIYTSTSLEVVFVAKPLSLTGGYSTANWEAPAPTMFPTIIDAEYSVRKGINVAAPPTQTVLIDGFSVRNSRDSYAVYISNGTVTITNCRITGSNLVSGSSAGGVYVAAGDVTIMHNTIRSHRNECVRGLSAGVAIGGGRVRLGNNSIGYNTSSCDYRPSVGIYLSGGEVTATNNLIESNRVGVDMAYTSAVAHALLSGNTVRDNSGCGIAIGGHAVAGTTISITENLIESNQGGLNLSSDPGAWIAYNTLRGNHGTNGGGIYAYDSSATLIGNSIEDSNASQQGGGLYADHSTLELVGNSFHNNTASWRGGAVYALQSSLRLHGNVFRLNSSNEATAMVLYDSVVEGENDVFCDNASSSAIEAVRVSSGSLLARHWTLADNGKVAINVDSGSAAITNCVVASHTVAALAGSGLAADHTLFFDNAADCASGAVCGSSLTGDPRFVDPASGDYHLGSGSAAVDAGIDAGVVLDIDGETRPVGPGFDLGADEQQMAPVASFVSSSPDWLGETTSFTNTTVVTGPVSFLWSFGDGTGSVEASPAHQYAAIGVYGVTMTATNSAGKAVAEGTAVVCGPSFTSSSPDWLGETTSFTNTSVTVGPTSYQWLFGDSTTAEGVTATHTYSVAGWYTVTLRATSLGGYGEAAEAIVVYSPPTATFTAHPVAGSRPLTVTFSADPPTVPMGDPTLSYLWAFGDGATSTLASPVHTYLEAGVYSPALTVTNQVGMDVASRTNYITVTHAPSHASFSAAPTEGEAPLMVQFTNTSVGDFATSRWDFGDGITDTARDPAHTYMEPGSYTVTLTIDGDGGYDTETKPDCILVLVPLRRQFLPLILAGD